MFSSFCEENLRAATSTPNQRYSHAVATTVDTSSDKVDRMEWQPTSSGDGDVGHPTHVRFDSLGKTHSTSGNKRKASEDDGAPTEVKSMANQRADNDATPEYHTSDRTQNLANVARPGVKRVLCSDCGCRVREKNMVRHREFSCRGGTTGRVKIEVCVDNNSTSVEKMPVQAPGEGNATEIHIGVPSEDELCPDLPKSKSTTGVSIQEATIESESVVDLCSDVDSNQRRGDSETTDPELDRVYEEVDISPNSVQQLEKHGITTLNELLKRQNELETGALAGVKKQTQRRLYTFCLWHQDFYAEHAPHVAWQGCFDDNDDLLAEFEQEVQLTDSASFMSETAIPILFEHAVNMLHEGGTAMGYLNSLPDHYYQLLYEYAAKKVYDSMPDDLQERCHFPIESFAFKIIKAIFNLPSGKPSRKTFLVNGRTQVGKTAFNALMVVISETLECLLLTTTHGVSESGDLREKIKGYVRHSKTRGRIFKHFGRKSSEAWVAANTYQRLEAAVKEIEGRRKLKESGKFWIAFDEADTIFRTIGGDQKTEKAINSLIQLGPCVRILVSATSVPCILACLEEEGTETEILQVGTAEDYCGIDEMRPLKDKKGNFVFLRSNEISQKGGVVYSHVVELDVETDDMVPLFPIDQGTFDNEIKQRFTACANLTFIPYTNDSVMKMFAQALSDVGKKGVLLLDCTAIRVNVGYTIFHKAACIQNYFHRQGNSMVVVVFVGQQIHVRRPGYIKGRFVSSKKKTIQQVLEQLDKEFGLAMPFAVFGYNKMRRCISYRSNRRVPTHMILKLGAGHSNENFVQALGRGSGNCKSVLKENGHRCVTLLTDRNDFLMATKYENFFPEIADRQKKGRSLAEAFDATDCKLPDSANFLQHSRRKVGQRKDFRAKCPGQDRYETPIKFDWNGKNWTSIFVQGVLRAVRDLTLEDGKDSFTVSEIEKKFNATYPSLRFGISKHNLNNIIRDLCGDDVLQHNDADAGGLRRYAAKDITAFYSLINQDLNDHFQSTFSKASTFPDISLS